MRPSLLTLTAIIGAIWIGHVINVLMDYKLNVYGVDPRTLDGLRGIPAHPFLHHGLNHAVSNTIGLLVLGGITALTTRDRFPWVSVLIVLLSGCALWVVGRSATHIGASGLVFGYFGYTIARGWLDRKPLSVIVAMLTIVLFGSSILAGLLPTRGPISWEGHVCGLLAGALTARLIGATHLEPRENTP